MMDFHCLIKVQLGPGAELYLSARYSSRVAQLACAEAIWPGQSPDFGLVSPSLRRPVLLPFGGPRLIFRSSILLSAAFRDSSESGFKNGPVAPNRVPEGLLH